MSVQRGAQLVVVHAVSKNTPYSWGAVERVTVLAALRERAEALKVPVRVRTQQGDTAEVVLLHASAQSPDLIVMGSHEPIGLARFRFGSIADRVVRGATSRYCSFQPRPHKPRLPSVGSCVPLISLHDRQR